ncbi:TPA: phage tail spike protein [Streptococcus suis]
MIYLFDKDEKLIKIVRKSAVKTALQKYALTTERYVSDRLTVELKGLNMDELEQVEYMAIQTMEDAHTFHYFYVAQKFSDELTTLIGVQSGIEELRKSPVYDKRPQNALARDVIIDLLAETNWQARFVGESTPHSTNFYYTSIFDALKKVCEVWDLEMQFFVEMNGNRIGARYIDFKQRIGEAVGKRVVYGHNALQILQEVERTNIFTALVGRGKGEETGDGYGRKITFENVVWSKTQGKPVDKPKGQKYLELPLMTRQYGIKNADGSMRPKIGYVDFSEEENPEILIERTYKALIDAARPQLTLKTSSVYLREVKVGDTIRVVRHDKKLDYDTRIFEITFNRLNNQSSDIKLGDRIGESNEAKVQTIADKAVEQFITNEFSNFVQNLPDYLPSADGFNNNWYGTEDPTVKYPGKVLINDIWYKPDPEHEGHKIMLRWTGEVWEEILRTYESESLRERIAEEIAQVNQSMQTQSEEHDRQVADILSKTQSIESLANQAKSDAASAIARANQVKTEAIADARAQVATVSQALNTAKSELQTAIASADQKARDSQASATALRNDLNSQANKILAQAQAQTALTNRVTTVETLADGTRSTVTELSKTVNKATGDIASVSSRTKTVEDTLSQTRTQYEALTQTVNAQTGQIDSINRKTADLQSGIDGVTERFESLQVGGKNLIAGSKTFVGTHWEKVGTWRLEEALYKEAGVLTWVSGNKVSPMANIAVDAGEVYTFSAFVKKESIGTVYFYLYDPTESRFATANVARETRINNVGNNFQRFSISFTATRTGMLRPRFAIQNNDTGGFSVAGYQLERGSLPTDYNESTEDFRSEFATYVRNASENSAELVKRIETANGKAVDAESYAQQTAEGFESRIESLETYKDAEGTRAQTYFTAAKNETAKQLTAERAVIANNYLAKSVYEEDARGTTLKLNEIKSTADTAKQNLATYQNTVDRKLEELASSTQTLDGKINTASTKVDTVAGQIRTEISEVEGKIPTDFDGLNLMTGTRDWSTKANPWHMGAGWVIEQNEYEGLKVHSTQRGFNGSHQNIFVKSGDVVTYSFFAKATQPLNNVKVSATWTGSSVYQAPVARVAESDDVIIISDSWKRYSKTVHVTSDGSLQFRTEYGASTIPNGNKLYIAGLKLAKSSVDTGYSENPSDLMTEIASVKTTITNTAKGVEQLSNEVLNVGDKITTAETEIRNLVKEVSSKVSQTDYNTLTGRMDNAETAISQHADEINKRLTKTQVEKAVTDKGYATVTVLENKVKETADSFSRTISETKALIPAETSGNLILNGNQSWSSRSYLAKEYQLAEPLEAGMTYTLVIHWWRGSGASSNYVPMLYYNGGNLQLTSPTNSTHLQESPTSLKYNAKIDSWVVTFTVKTRDAMSASQLTDFGKPNPVIRVYRYGSETANQNNNQSTAETAASFATLVKGTIPLSRWEPSYAELATVTALHNVEDTVSSHTRTIGAIGETGSILDNVSKVTQTANGLVQEVTGEGGLKTQVSTLAGSYAIKSLTKAGDVLGQINLNKDGSVRINEGLISIGERTYIKDGVIKSAMIGEGQIGTAHIGEIDAGIAKIINLDVSNIKGLDAAFIKAKIKNAFIEWMKGKTITAQNEAMTIGLNDAFIRFKDNAKIEFQSENNTLYRTKNGTSAFIHFRDDSYNGVYTAMGVNADNTGTQNDYSSGSFAGVRVIRSNPSRYSGTTVDQVQLVGDEIRIRHGYGYENDYLVIKWDNQGKIDLIKFLRSVASRLGLPLT